MGVVEIQTAPAAQEHVSAQPGNGQAGEDTQPRIQLLGHDVTRGVESNRAQGKHTRRMRSGHDDPEQQRMPRRTSRADQVGSDDRLSVAWFQGVQGAQSEGDEGGRDEEPQAQPAGSDQLSECVARGRLLIRL